MIQIFGGCLCQKIQYQISSPPLSTGICYCHQCQKSGGAYGSPLLVLHKDQFECSQENLSSCKTNSDRGSLVTRYFCKECGSHIFSQISDVPEVVTVKAATLKEFKNFIPEYLVWTQSAPSSCTFPQDIPSFPQSAPLEMIFGKPKGADTLLGHSESQK